ncbi:MAG TPA: inorganic phosphate transporter [Thermoanaerobaculia bacterium]|nr:inorganic phosphate transporter [Thermoanaerobaculia bacterium]HPA51653.1 inorganic phosphate transporter [Thermoanaerobaculia bacterium]HQN07641.1 inorganic phosphate transporter [Thermoanaerobaculia bacterium]HQP85377.1 inorganic phosphate transporter [Thermoanaerobaculia bacterium]
MTYIVFIIVVALVFDYINGFHDAANSIATVVGTRVLSPRVAVVWAAFFNFAAAFALETRVAQTIGKGIVRSDVVDPDLVLASLAGAIVWNLLTWWWGLPSSSSHALIGGFAGAAFVKAGAGSLVMKGLLVTSAFIVLSPLLGLALGFLNFLGAQWAFRRWRPDRVDRVFRKVQLASAAAFSFGHGMNDAQKTMGIIFALLVSTGHLSGSHIPFWIVLLCFAAISLGTLSGGWRIVRTMSMRITPLKPIGGSCAELAGAATLVGASLGGIPVSTTHTITGAIMGVGASRSLSSVRWGVARSIVVAWVLTIPASALVAGLTWKLFDFLRG